MALMTPIQELYTKKVRSELQKELGIANPMAVPRVTKIVINTGIGKINKDQRAVDEIVASLSAMTGQKPILTKAKKAIAGFKVREGLEVGVAVTLHGKRMWEFLDRLLHVALPRVRDFQGLADTIVDEFGNANIGIREHSVFPEIVPEKVQHLFGFQVTIVTTAQNRKEGLALFRLLGVPIRKDEHEAKQ